MPQVSASGSVSSRVFTPSSVLVFLLVLAGAAFGLVIPAEGDWAVPFVMLSGAGIFVLALIRPVAVVYFWVFFAPISVSVKDVELISGLKQSLYGSMNVFVLPVLTIVLFMRIGKFKSSIKFLYPFAVFIGAVSASSAIEGALDISALRVIAGNLTFLLLGLLAFSFVESEREMRRVMVFSVLSGGLICLFSMADFFLAGRYVWMEESLARMGTFAHGNPNELALYALILLSVSLSGIKSAGSPAGRAGWFSCAALFSLTVFLTFSVSGWMALIVFFLTVLFIGIMKKGRLLKTVLISMYIVAAVVVVWKSGLYGVYVPERFKGGGTADMRLEVIWPAAVGLIMEKPLLGYPPSQAGGALSDISPTSSAHNMALAFLLGSGITGLLAVLVTFWRILKRLNHIRKSSSSPLLSGLSGRLMAVMFAVFVYGMGHSVGFSPHHMLVFWMVSLSVIGLSARLERGMR